MNILANAVKFTHHGYIKIEFQKDFENILTISIEDSGIGIDKEKISYIFDMLSFSLKKSQQK